MHVDVNTLLRTMWPNLLSNKISDVWTHNALYVFANLALKPKYSGRIVCISLLMIDSHAIDFVVPLNGKTFVHRGKFGIYHINSYPYQFDQSQVLITKSGIISIYLEIFNTNVNWYENRAKVCPVAKVALFCGTRVLFFHGERFHLHICLHTVLNDMNCRHIYTYLFFLKHKGLVHTYVRPSRLVIIVHAAIDLSLCHTERLLWSSKRPPPPENVGIPASQYMSSG